jgi:hypothetical protein
MDGLDEGSAGERVHSKIQWVAQWWRRPWLQSDLWFWAFPVAFVVEFLPSDYYVIPDVVLSIFTAAFLLYGLYTSFVGRAFTELQYLSVSVMVFIGLAQLGELRVHPWFTGVWHWLWITGFKAMLCLLFIALTYTWIHQKAQHLRWVEGPDGIIVFPPKEEIRDIGDGVLTQPIEPIDVDFSKLSQEKLKGPFGEIEAKITTTIELL